MLRASEPPRRSGSVTAISHRDLPRMSRSVTLDEVCIKRYFDHYALAHAFDDLAPHANSASRRRLAEAAAHGGRASARVRLDPPRDTRDHRALSVARPGD